MKTQATASFLLHTKISEFPKIDQEEVLQKVKKNIVEFIQNTTVDEKKKKKSLEIVQHVSIDDITINSHNRLIDILTTKSYVDNIINSHEFQNILNTVYLKKYNNSAIIFNDDQKKYVKDWSDIIQKDLVQLLLKEANCYTDDDRHDLDGIINLIFSNAGDNIHSIYTPNAAKLLEFIKKINIPVQTQFQPNASIMKLFLTNPITGPIGTEGVAPIDEAISVERILEIRYEITTKITLPSNYGKIIKTIKLYAQEAENSSKKIKIIMQVTDNAAIDTIEKDYIKYIVYCFCKYLGISRADFCKIVEINYIASNTTNQATQKNQTNGKGQQGELFNKKDLHNEKYIQAGPIIPHNNNKDAVHLMTKWIESVLGFGATNHVLLIGPESSGKKALAHRSIGKVVSIAPNLKITEISLISLQTKWNDICKQNYAQTNQNNNLFKEFNDQFKDTDILMLHLDKVVLSDKLTDRLKGMLSNTGMKCIFIAESLGLSQIQKMIAPDIQAQPAYLSQPEPKYRAKILTGMLKQNEITNIDEKIINTIALRTHSTNDFPQIIKTIKDHITESKPINHETIITYLEKIFVMSYPSYTLDNLQKRIQEYILDNEVSISDHDVTMRLAYFASKLPKGGTENEPSRFTEDDIALRSDKPGSAIKKYIKNGMNNSNTALKIALEKYIKNKLEEKLIIFDATWI